MEKTLWTDREKKFKPRNLQAALICRKARDIFKPPPEPTIPRQPSKEEILKGLELKIAEGERLREEERQRQEEGRRKCREKNAAARARKLAAPPKCMWASQWARRLAKQKGLPKPPIEEQRRIRKEAAGIV